MGRFRSSALLAAVLAAAVLSACGGRETKQQTSAPAERRGPLENPSDFPLYPRSSVVVVVPVSSAQMFAAIRASDPSAKLPKNFRGNEIIAETSASMRQLGAWVDGLKHAPPRGLHDTTSQRSSSTDTTYNAADVAVGASFESGSSNRSVYVIAADPKKLRETLGPAFALIDNYSAVPGMLRGPIDEQAKQQFGYTVTEMLDQKSPVGAAVAELKRLQSADRRAILIVDESKAK
jgi:hypothetical protein